MKARMENNRVPMRRVRSPHSPRSYGAPQTEEGNSGTTNGDEGALARRALAWYACTKRALCRAERDRDVTGAGRSLVRRLRRFLQRACLKQPQRWWKEGKAVLANLIRFGRPIKKAYGVPLYRQLLGMCYMIFRADIPLEGDVPVDDWHYVPVYPDRATHYYGYRLFVPQRWKYVDEYIYYSWPVHPGLNHLFRPDTGLYGKLRFFERCRARGIPTPPVLASFKDGDVHFHGNHSEGFPPTNLFVKPNSESGGHGTEKYTYEDGHYVGSDGAAYDAVMLTERLRTRSREGRLLLVQPYLPNHIEWAPFSTGALITMRVVTGRTLEGRVQPIAACFRMPVGTMVVDNVSAGGLVSSMDLRTGALGAAVKKLPYDGILGYDRHPDTHELLKGAEVPRWREALRFACSAHEAFETVFIGWDVALTEHGFMAVEGNLGWEARLMEIASDAPLVRTRYAALYDEWMMQLSEQCIDPETPDPTARNVTRTIEP